MRVIEKVVYSLEELTKEGKDSAYHEWLSSGYYPFTIENTETLEEFEKVFPISIRNWEYDQFDGRVSYSFEEDEEIEELSGIRLLKYLFNNYWYQITSRKFYFTGGGISIDSKTRHSNFQREVGNCPFTGYYMDEEILKPIHEFMHNPDEHTNFNDLMRECLDSWIAACVDDYEYHCSEEYFEEYCETNDIEFYENGTIY